MPHMPTHARLRSVVLLCLFSLVPAAALTAQTAPEGANTANRQVILTFTSKSFQLIVQGLGFETTRGKDDAGKENDYFSFRAEGYKVIGFVNNGYLQLYMGFNDVKPTLDAVNTWNAKHSLTRAYAGKDGTANLESDLFTQGGVTQDAVENFVKTFRDIAPVWAAYAQASEK